jgi:hypothetical protein
MLRNPRFQRGLIPGVLALAALAACPSPPPAPEAEPLFRTIETGGPREAIEATDQLARIYVDSLGPRLERVLAASPARALHLLGMLGTPGSAKLLLERLPNLLDSGDAAVSRMAVVTAGLRRLEEATAPILDRLEKLDGHAAFRALGRIWERRLDDPPLPRPREIRRLAVLALAHRWGMEPSPLPEACEAMLRVMTREELERFLERNARDRFPSRRTVAEATGRRGFDPAKGLRVHEALLASPDPDLVAALLEGSPHALAPELLRPLLEDKRATRDGRPLRELAARRLERAR